MLENWIFWSLLAAVMQSVRTAGQKYLTADVSPLGATLVRYLFAVPFIVAYIGWLLHDRATDIPPLNTTFVVCSLGAGVLQIIATVLLVRLFTLRNLGIHNLGGERHIKRVAPCWRMRGREKIHHPNYFKKL